MILKFRRILIVMLALALNASAFALEINDMDDKAFITKAEFDVLKNEFQNQMDIYNARVDEKIDSAIASYLAGITVETTPTNLWTEVVSRTGGPLWFLNKIDSVGKDTIQINKKISLRRQLAAYGVWKFREMWKYWSGTPYAHANSAWSIAVLYSVAGENSTTIDSAAQYRVFQTRLEVDRRGSTSTWSTRETSAPIIHPPDALFPTYSDYFTNTAYNDIGIVNSLKSDISSLNSVEETGDGATWVYHIDPDGSSYISEFNTLIFPVVNIHAYVHNYQSFKIPQTSSDPRGEAARNNFIQWYETDNGKAYTTTEMQTYTADLPNGYGSRITANTAGSTIPSDTSTTDNEYYIKVDLSKIAITDGVDYTTKQFGKNSCTNVYCLRDIQMPDYSTTEYDNIDVTNITWTDSYYTQVGRETQTNEMNDIRVRWNKLSLTPSVNKISDFQNNILTAVAGQTVYNGGGVPIAKFVNDTSSTIKLAFDVSTGTGDVHYMLSEKQFIDGNFNASARVKHYGTVAPNTEITITNDFMKDELLWLNCYSLTDGVEATINTFTITG